MLLPNGELTPVVHLHELRRGPRQHFVLHNDAIGSAVLDAIRHELECDPLIHTHRAHLRDVGGARAESETVQDLLHLLIGRLLARLRGRHDDQGSECSGRRCGARRARRACADEQEKNK